MPLKIWINAFIPRTVTGYTRVLSGGPHAGKTAVPLPGVGRLNPLNTFKNWDAGYLTDQRTFSDSPTASVRMQSLVELTLTPEPRVTRTAHTSSGTTEVDMDTGRQLGFAVADMSRCSFSPLRIEPPVRQGGQYRTPFLGIPYTVNTPMSGPPTYVLRLEGMAGDPLVSAAADIDYVGEFRIYLHPPTNRCHVDFTGKIDAFPAYECYAQLDGKTKCLFTNSPPAGNTVADLLGGPNRSIFGGVTFP